MKIKTRLVVYLKKISENILTKVSLLGELKFMQHKNHSYSTFFLFVSCAFSRWIWPDTSNMLMSTSSTDENTKTTSIMFLSLAIGWKSSFPSLQNVISYKHACLCLWYDVNWTFVFVFLCWLFSQLVVLRWCILSLAAVCFCLFYCVRPLEDVSWLPPPRKSTCRDLTCRTLQSKAIFTLTGNEMLWS